MRIGLASQVGRALGKAARLVYHQNTPPEPTGPTIPLHVLLLARHAERPQGAVRKGPVLRFYHSGSPDERPPLANASPNANDSHHSPGDENSDIDVPLLPRTRRTGWISAASKVIEHLPAERDHALILVGDGANMEAVSTKFTAYVRDGEEGVAVRMAACAGEVIGLTYHIFGYSEYPDYLAEHPASGRDADAAIHEDLSYATLQPAHQLMDLEQGDDDDTINIHNNTRLQHTAQQLMDLEQGDDDDTTNIHSNIELQWALDPAGVSMHSFLRRVGHKKHLFVEYLKCPMQSYSGNSRVYLAPNLHSVSKFQDLLSCQTHNGLYTMVHRARLCDYARLLLWLEKGPTATIAYALAWDRSAATSPTGTGLGNTGVTGNLNMGGTGQEHIQDRIATLAGITRYLIGLTPTEKVFDEMLLDRQSMWTRVHTERRCRGQDAAELKRGLGGQAFHGLQWLVDCTDWGIAHVLRRIEAMFEMAVREGWVAGVASVDELREMKADKVDLDKYVLKKDMVEMLKDTKVDKVDLKKDMLEMLKELCKEGALAPLLRES